MRLVTMHDNIAREMFESSRLFLTYHGFGKLIYTR